MEKIKTWMENKMDGEDKNLDGEDKKGDQKKSNLEALEKIIEERSKRKDDTTTCEWCGMIYPKGGWTYYKLRVRNMSIEKLVENIKKGIGTDEFEERIICSDCYDRLGVCKEC